MYRCIDNTDLFDCCVNLAGKREERRVERFVFFFVLLFFNAQSLNFVLLSSSHLIKCGWEEDHHTYIRKRVTVLRLKNRKGYEQ